MSGHSHWSTIKHKKGVEDKKRGQVFSKFSRLILIAAKKGGDPTMNSELRMAIDRARKANMPSEKIEKAIKKGTGELKGESLEEFCFEAYGPSKSALIITGITSNKNRALSEVKQILNQNKAKLAQEGSVKWQFEQMGIILIACSSEKDKEKLEITAIEAGIEDIRQQKGLLETYTKSDDLESVKKKIEDKGIVIESTGLGWVAKEKIALDEKSQVIVEKLLNALDDNDDVQEVYSNIRLF